jgi:protein SCO1/2
MKFRNLLIAFVVFALFSQGQPKGTAAQKYFTDTVLIDQDGIERRFYTDLISGKAVVIQVMFTTCKDSCPVMAKNFEWIQQSLGARVGQDVHMLSISIDPETDSPARLKEYAERFKARPGWYVLGGKKENVEFVLQKLGLLVAQKQDHLNLFLIGNDRTGLWKKALGISDPVKLIEIVNSVVRDGE